MLTLARENVTPERRRPHVPRARARAADGRVRREGRAAPVRQAVLELRQGPVRVRRRLRVPARHRFIRFLPGASARRRKIGRDDVDVRPRRRRGRTPGSAEVLHAQVAGAARRGPRPLAARARAGARRRVRADARRLEMPTLLGMRVPDGAAPREPTPRRVRQPLPGDHRHHAQAHARDDAAETPRGRRRRAENLRAARGGELVRRLRRRSLRRRRRRRRRRRERDQARRRVDRQASRRRRGTRHRRHSHRPRGAGADAAGRRGSRREDGYVGRAALRSRSAHAPRPQG